MNQPNHEATLPVPATKTPHVFIVGHARSGTSVFCDALNLSDEVHLLHEAHFFAHPRVADYVAFFNRQHRAFGNTRSKGTWLAPSSAPETAAELLERLARDHRYAGEKIAFGSSAVDGRAAQDAFFEHHSASFPQAWHLVLVRDPVEVVWSSTKKWPTVPTSGHLEGWLRSLKLAIELGEVFSGARLLFWDRFDERVVRAVARLLDIELAVPPGMIGPQHQRLAIADGVLPCRLRPMARALEVCRDLYGRARDAYSPDTFRFHRPGNRRKFIEELQEGIQGCLDSLSAAETCQPAAVDPRHRERLTPEESTGFEINEHLSRYQFAAAFVDGRRVLDVGCGKGYGTRMLEQAGAAAVVGVDASEEAVQYARGSAAGAAATFEVGSLPHLPFPDSSFDVVVMLEVIEHVQDMASSLRAIRRVLTEDGILVLSTPNQAEHPGESFNPYHVRELTRAELGSLLAPTFRHVELLGFGFVAGTYISPARVADPHRTDVDARLLGPVNSEAPFHMAVCSNRAAAVPLEARTILPLSFDRRDMGDLVHREQRRRFADDLYGELVEQLLADGHRAAAISVCVRQLARNPRSGQWHHLHGRCEFGVNHEAALAAFDEAFAVGYDTFWLRIDRGATLRSVGRLEASASDLEAAVTLRPNDEGARWNLRETLKLLARRALDDDRPSDAGDWLSDRHGRRPGDAEWHMLRAEVYRRSGRADAADLEYAVALAEGFDPYWVAVGRGHLHAGLGHLSQALAEYETAITCRPGDAAATQGRDEIRARIDATSNA